MAPPRVFVSYSHDSDVHKIWVLRLATDLRERYGIDAILDHWDVDLGADLPKFMEGILKTDRVLMICTDTYTRKCDVAEAGGVYVEKRLMSADILRGRPPETFIPVIRDNADGKLPDFLAGPRYIDFRNDLKYSECLWELAASIHGVKTRKPPIGRNPFEKGLDAGFGNGGISILRGIDVSGFRLATERDYFYVTGVCKSNCCVVRIASNGQLDDTFGDSGLKLLPNLPRSDVLTDLIYVDGHVVALDRSSEQGASVCAVRNGALIDQFRPNVRVIAAAPFRKASRIFDRRTQSGAVLFFDQPSSNGEFPGYTLFSHSIQLGGPAWVRAKRIEDRIYFFGRAENESVSIQRFVLNGELDETFGDRGTVLLKGDGYFNHGISELVEDGNGCIVAIGSGNEAPVVRLLPDGSPDSNFGELGYLQFRAAQRTVGKMLAAIGQNLFLSGDEYDGNSIYNCFAAMLDHAGNPREDFGLDGSISVLTGSQDEHLDCDCSGTNATILFQHDRHADIRHRLGLARIHLTNV